MFGYLILILLGLSELKFWDFSLLKDTTFWIIVVGIALVFKSVDKDITHFKKILFNSVKFTIVIEFFINLHVFSYWFELVLLPSLLIIFLLQGFSEDKKEYESVYKFFTVAISIIGFSLFLFACYKTFQNFKNDFTIINLKKLLFPTILTVLFIPYAYLIAVFSSYEILFGKLKHVKNSMFTRRKIRFEIIKTAKLNLSVVRTLNSKIDTYELEVSNNIKEYIKTIKK